MNRKDLQHLKIEATFSPQLADASVSIALDGISIPQHDTEDNIEALESFDFAAGFPPFLRGITPTMYVTQPGNITSFQSTATQEKGQAEHKVAISLYLTPTPVEDQPTTDRKGRGVHSTEDLKDVIRHLPLRHLDLTLATSSDLIPILALYFAAAQEEGIDLSQAKGTIHSDGFQAFNTNYSLNTIEQHQTNVLDVVAYLQVHAPHYRALSMSNATLQHWNVEAPKEVAYSLAQGLNYLKAGVARHLPLDVLALHSFYSWTTSTNFFLEIAKMRATRWLWSTLVQPLDLKKEALGALSIHAQTSLPQDLVNSDCFTHAMLEATTAIFGGVQSLTLATSSAADTSNVRTAETIQHFLREETKSDKTVDPWAGSYYLETLTQQIATQAWEHLQAIEQAGGLSTTLAATLVQPYLEKASQDSRAVTATAALDTQVKKRGEQRDEDRVASTLAALASSVKTGTGNRLAYAIEAARAKATGTEIQQALTL